MAINELSHDINVRNIDLPIIIADGQTVGSSEVYMNGMITRLVLELPDLTTDTTAILTIEDYKDQEIYNSDAQNDNRATSLSVEGNVSGKLTFKITCASAQSGAKTCNVTITFK